MHANKQVAEKLLARLGADLPPIVAESIERLGDREDQAASDALVESMTNLDLASRLNKEEIREWYEWIKELEPFTKFAATLIALF